MDAVAIYHGLIDSTLRASGMSDKVLHVHVGMAIYVLARIVIRDRRGSAFALMLVFGLEIANETMDALFFGAWRWADTLGDITATVFWPTIEFMTSRYRRASWANDRKRRGQAADGSLSIRSAPPSTR